jgi:hypothetical protein
MRKRTALGLRGVWALLLAAFQAGCQGTGAIPPAAAPEPARIQAPALYAGTESPQDVSAEPQTDDVCKLDPTACPTLSRQAVAVKEQIFAVQQVSDGPEIQLSGPLTGAPAVRAERASGALTASAAEAPTAIPTAGARQRPELFDIEAHSVVEVTDLAAARSRLARALEAAHGRMVNEVVEDQPSTRGASLSLRVPSDRVLAFLAGLGELGRVRSQKVETREVGRALNDAEILLQNLTLELARYQGLLDKAGAVEEMLKIEAELNRVRASIDRVRGDLAWLRDRAAYSTVYVTLSLGDEALPGEATAKLHPGVFATLLWDVPPQGSQRAFAGGGFSLAWSRSFGLDLALMKRSDAPSRSTFDAALVTLGSELYSDFLGGGQRRFLNPYFGVRGGYARELGDDAFVLGGALGVELYKTRFFLLDLQARGYALLGLAGGVHAGAEPLLGASFAY